MTNQIDKYISNQPKQNQDILNNIRNLTKKTSPKAEEQLIYGVPGFKLNNKYLICYAGFKKHIGIYPEPDSIEHFKDQLKIYETSKGAIKFPLDKEIPYNLIKKIIQFKANKISNK